MIATLPEDAVTRHAEVWSALMVAPWAAGGPLVETNPDGAVRRLHFGEGKGLVVFVVVEHAREVMVVQINWVG